MVGPSRSEHIAQVADKAWNEVGQTGAASNVIVEELLHHHHQKATFLPGTFWADQQRRAKTTILFRSIMQTSGCCDLTRS